MIEQHAGTADNAGNASPAGESPWVDEAEYPHRIENHVKVYLHVDESAIGPRWVVSPVTVDGYPLDGVEAGNYCDYDGHPPGARPDWDRQHRLAQDLSLPTAAELLPILATALGTRVGPTAEQLRAASDLIDAHAEWRSERADLSAGESSTDEDPAATDRRGSDEVGRDLTDRAVALLVELTSPTDELFCPGSGSDVSMMRTMLEVSRGGSPATDVSLPCSTTRSGPPR